GRVQARAQVEVRVLVPGLGEVALVARPAEVRHTRRRVRDSVDFLPGVPADVADPHLVRTRTDREAERVAQAVRDDPPRVGVAARRERVVRQGRTGVRVQPQYGAVEPGRVAGRTDVLRA